MDLTLDDLFVLSKNEITPASKICAQAFIDNPILMCNYLGKCFKGVSLHP